MGDAIARYKCSFYTFTSGERIATSCLSATYVEVCTGQMKTGTNAYQEIPSGTGERVVQRGEVRGVSECTRFTEFSEVCWWINSKCFQS